MSPFLRSTVAKVTRGGSSSIRKFSSHPIFVESVEPAVIWVRCLSLGAGYCSGYFISGDVTAGRAQELLGEYPVEIVNQKEKM